MIRHHPGSRVVSAGDERASVADLVGKVQEHARVFVGRAVQVDVIPLDVGHDSDDGREGQKGAAILIGFDHKLTATA